MLEQRTTTPTQFAEAVGALFDDKALAAEMRASLRELYRPEAAELIAHKIMLLMEARGRWTPARSVAQTNLHSDLRHSQVLTA